MTTPLKPEASLTAFRAIGSYLWCSDLDCAECNENARAADRLLRRLGLALVKKPAAKGRRKGKK